ncbi:MAG: hypothetical protein AAGJ10_09970 [Bacteroidota bacterium]
MIRAVISVLTLLLGCAPAADPADTASSPLGAPSSDCTGGVFTLVDNAVVFEAESQPLSDGWVLESNVPDYSGDGYITWGQPTTTQADDQGLLAYRFRVENPGTYTVKLRNYHPCEDFTECNDVFLRVNDTEWRKNFNHTLRAWDWNSQQDVDHVFSDAQYDLGAGLHTLYLSGRSEDFSIDQIAIFRTDVPEAQYQDLAPSPCAALSGE